MTLLLFLDNRGLNNEPVFRCSVLRLLIAKVGCCVGVQEHGDAQDFGSPIALR